MSERKSEYQVRKEKLEQLRARGVNPYVENFDKTHTIGDVISLYDAKTDLRDSEVIVSSPVMQVSTAGRVTLFRTHGKLSFARIQDGTGEIQVLFHKDNCSIDMAGEHMAEVGLWEQGTSAYKFFEKMIDVGDFVWVRGEVFRTHKGELTIFAPQFTLLTKALLPLGDKFHGIEDMDTRLRKRYLDVVFHSDVRDMLYRRSKFWQEMRNFLLKHSFMEVETPILETTTWWADANPFATHHNALDLDVFLRISCWELRQKRLMVAGFEKTFEIGRIFRNEGMSPEHAQDYTQMENYRAYADYRQMMALVKDMYMHIIDTVYPHKNRKFTIRGYDVDFNQEWQEIDYATIIKEKTDIDIFTATEEQIEKKLTELHVKYEPHNRIRLIDTLRKYCRKQLSWPAFLVNVPTFISPLAKSKIDKPELTNRFQVIIAGSEVGNGFSELNDPLDQRSRFEEQQAMRDAGDDEAQMADREYVEALEHGMPPTAWFGVSERLFCFLEDKPIREAQYFPLMKPEHDTTWSEPVIASETKWSAAIQDSIIYKDNLTADDREIYKKIRLECLLNEKDAFGDKYDIEAAFTEQEWKDKLRPWRYVVVAFDKKIPVAMMVVMPWKDDNSIGGIFGVYVNEKYRKQGIAKHMMQMCLSHIFDALQLDTARIDVLTTAPIAKSFYDTLWFVQTETIEEDINWKQHTAIRMELTKDAYTKIATSSATPRNDVTYTNLPSTSDAQALADKYLTETRKHCEQVGKIMQYFAKKLWQDQDARYIAGLLHDVDRDHIGKDPHKHLGEEFEKIVGEIDLSDQLIADIRSHYTEKTGVPVDLLIRKYLSAVDELSGLMYAYSLMRPEWFVGMEAKSVMKKIKDKKFAAGVDREHVRNCEKYLNIPLEEFIPQVIEALVS